MIENDHRCYVSRQPAFAEFLVHRYRVIMATRDGVWYEEPARAE